jgi:archaellum component FlaF (FlaF/FlaG flagellin family)
MDESYQSKLQEEFRKSERNVDIPLTLFGNKKTIVGIVSLLGYIRNAINSNKTTKINLEIGNTIENDKFDFLLDGETVPDMKIVDTVQIN